MQVRRRSEAARPASSASSIEAKERTPSYTSCPPRPDVPRGTLEPGGGSFGSGAGASRDVPRGTSPARSTGTTTSTRARRPPRYRVATEPLGTASGAASAKMRPPGRTSCRANASHSAGEKVARESATSKLTGSAWASASPAHRAHADPLTQPELTDGGAQKCALLGNRLT